MKTQYNKPTLYIICDVVNAPRLQYVTNFLFGSIANIPFKLVCSQVNISPDQPTLYYSKNSTNNELCIRPHGILNQSGIKTINVSEPEYINNTPYFFRTKKGKEQTAFDIFSASFYLLSQYELYGNPKTDLYGRYDEKTSFLRKNNIYKIPLIEKWTIALIAELNARFGNVFGNAFAHRTFTFTPTIDIDSFYAYKGKGLMRTIGGYVRDFFARNWKQSTLRTQVLLGLKEDPFQTFGLLEGFHKNLVPIYFATLATHGALDKNISHKNKKLRSQLRQISSSTALGIHPGFASNDNAKILDLELGRFSNIVGKAATMSRQHFLKYKLPDTFAALIAHKFTDDFSLGYSTDIGFRCGTCTPFLFYNLATNETTALTMHPFQLMDTAIFNNRKLSVNQANKAIDEIIAQVKSVGGSLISVWHNESFNYPSLYYSEKYIVYSHLIKTCTIG